MSVVQRFVQQARSSPRRIVFPEGFDPRVVQAAHRCASERIAFPIVLGDPALCAPQAGVSPQGIEWVDPQTSPLLDVCAQAYAQRRGVKPGVARRIMARDLYFACMMVATGAADGCVAGAAHTTASLLAAASLCIGPAPGVQTPSSFFIMDIPPRPGEQGRQIIFADCAVNIEPTPEQLADIAISAAHAARALLGVEPRVAMLSFSTRGSASHPAVDKMRRATEIARLAAPHLAIDGEMQGDAALSHRVAQAKAPGSPVAGQASVLVFPDLNSANIAYKLTQYLAGAEACGPILQGFASPVNDLSRGATAGDIFAVAAITVVQAQSQGEST